MYLCFCKSQELQNYFAECAYSKCASEAEQTVNFGVNLCKGMNRILAPFVVYLLNESYQKTLEFPSLLLLALR